MNIHKNARLTHYRREELVAQIHGAGGLGTSRRMEFLVAALLYLAL